MKKFFRVLIPVVVSLLLASGLFYEPPVTTYAEDEPLGTAVQEFPAEEGASTDDTSSEETAGETAGDDFNSEDISEDEHATFSEEMLSEAIALYADSAPALRNSSGQDSSGIPFRVLDEASLPYSGEGHILALQIDFPNDTVEGHRQFDADDSEEVFQAAIGPSLDRKEHSSSCEMPYDNLHNYYQRASYGKLFLYGDVYSYSAEKPRSEYADKLELLQEVLPALDDRIDYSAYDADRDLRIDCICIHIPYDPKDRWGTEWWSACASYEGWDLEADGVTAASTILLNKKLGDELGHATLIHEHGHAMGFPDYYSYERESTPTAPNGLSGILTFDMMDTDAGDHNGFSKWMAGWLTESDITRVVANEKGVSATKNSVSVGTKNTDGSVTLDLASFTSDDLYETGGIIVVGNDENAPFSSYYLIQYDSFKGNQKVKYYNYQSEEPLDIPSGFRVFRVQAELSPDNYLIHTNTYESPFNQLIELVDPDYLVPHSGGRVPCTGEDYGCMFFGESSLTPTSSPSTNFMENIDAGFTGISIEFLESNPDSGKLRISYSDKYKPKEKEFEITLDSSDFLPGGYHLEFTANQKLSLAHQYSMFARLSTDPSSTYYLRNISTDENRLSGDLYLDTDLLTKDATLSFRFGEGTFKIGRDTDSPVRELPIPISGDLTALSESGLIEGSEAVNGYAHVCSPVYQAEDGSYYFYEYSGGWMITSDSLIHKFSFDGSSPTDITVETVEYGSEDGTLAQNIFEQRMRYSATERAAVLPEGAELGDYPYVYDAVKIGDDFYVVSYREEYTSTSIKKETAVSRLDSEGKLIRQVVPLEDELTLFRFYLRRASLEAGPNNMLALQLYPPVQEKDDFAEHLSDHSTTIFFDLDLNMKGRLDNNSTGCGTWLPDGRFISFTQRMGTPMEMVESGIDNRTIYLAYDILDPASFEYAFEESGELPSWTKGSKDPLLFTAHRIGDDENTFAHFTGAAVDGKDLAEEDFSAASGSVKISLQPAYLETLSEGEHTLTAKFDDGSADTKFKILKKNGGASDDAKGQPATGDQANPLLWIVLSAAAFVCIIAAILIYALSRRRKNDRRND